MCGIAGCIIKTGTAAQVLYKSLKRLEYRGYDSCGIATIHGGVVLVKKDKGTIDDVDLRLNLREMPGKIGISHTRWATHGAPSQVNAHPHTDCSGTIAVVHNGIIENFIELRKELTDLGHIFRSKTDTEVIPHLIEENVKSGLDLFTAVVESVKRLRGSYAVCCIYAKEPDIIVCARNESPLVLGIANDALYCASDATAFIDHTNKAVFLENGEVCKISSSGYQIFKVNPGKFLDRKPITLLWNVEMAEKQGNPHFMLKEILEQPFTLRDSLRLQTVYVDLIAEFLDRAKDTFLIASGTSYHACLAGSYMFSKLARLTAYPVIASEFVENYGLSVNIDTVVLAISQSGETADVLNAIDFARHRAATILGITNVVGSTLTRISRAYILQNTGPEIGVAATKTYTSQLVVLAQLALRLARKRGKVSQYEMDEVSEWLTKIPDTVDKVIRSKSQQMKEIAKKYVSKPYFLFLGRGISYATAMEGRLKLMEITYIPCIAYPAGESKHGPISVVERGTTVVFVCPHDDTRDLAIGNMMEMKARGATIVSLAEEGDEEIREISDDFVGMPSTPPLLSPITYIVPLQLLAYFMAVEKGLDPDKPRNLAKSVTVL